MVNLKLIDKKSKLIICDDFAKTKQDIYEQKDNSSIYYYQEENILLKNTKEIIEHSYISMPKVEYIVICINTINTQSQNSLLKILEEPPKDKYFILLSSSKSIFLPTILSRLEIIKIKQSNNKTNDFEIGFDISKSTSIDIFNFIKKNKYISKEDCIKCIEKIFQQISKQNINIKFDILELFDKSIEMLYLNNKPIHTLSFVTLQIHQYFKKYEHSKTIKLDK